MKVSDMKDLKANKDKSSLELTGFDAEGSLISEKIKIAAPKEKLNSVSIVELDPQYARKMSVQ